MFKDILIVDNIFDNPDSILEYALKQEYYSSEDNPTIKNTDIVYPGTRTFWLEQKDFLKEAIHKVLSSSIRTETTMQLDLDISCLFHSLDKNYIYENQSHTDNVVFAGIIYLNKNWPEGGHGTIIHKHNGISVISQYRYNRLVLFRSDYEHSPMHGFGTTVETSRLTLNFFINKIDLNICGTMIKELR